MSDIPVGRTEAQQAALADVAASLLERFQLAQSQSFGDTLDLPVFQGAIDALRAIRPVEFGRLLCTPLSELVETLVRRELPGKSQAQFLFQRGDFVMGHVRQLMEGFEGLACCADKSRSVIQLMAVRSAGKPGAEFIRDSATSYSLPKVILTTGQACEDFLKALQLLYHGRPEGYLQALDGFYRARAASKVTQE